MKAVNQCVGRVIRHAGDHAAVVLADARYLPAPHALTQAHAQQAAHCAEEKRTSPCNPTPVRQGEAKPYARHGCTDLEHDCSHDAASGAAPAAGMMAASAMTGAAAVAAVAAVPGPPYPALQGSPLYKLPGWIQRSLVLGAESTAAGGGGGGRAAVGDYGHVHGQLVAFFKRMSVSAE